jgi:hypothetical protein
LRVAGQFPVSALIKHVDAVTLARLIYTSTLWRPGLFHKTVHTLANVKRYKLQDFAYGGLRGKELTHEKSF